MREAAGAVQGKAKIGLRGCAKSRSRARFFFLAGPELQLLYGAAGLERIMWETREREDYAKMQGTHSLYASRGCGTRLQDGAARERRSGSIIVWFGLEGSAEEECLVPGMGGGAGQTMI